MVGTFPMGTAKRKQQDEAEAEKQLRELAEKLGFTQFLRSPAEMAEIREAARPKRPFVVGDVVKLKSGGVQMTVTELRCASMVNLHYSYAGELLDADLPEYCLRVCEAGEINDLPDIPF